MQNLALKVENISKQYCLGQVGTGTLKHDLNRWWYKIRGKEDPYLKITGTHNCKRGTDLEYIWALHNINFEARQGDTIGIIGKNGAGKSTLLKLLSKVTKPTTGTIKIKNRIASLLEVGTGFHQEMTGRENIYLNGAILGMTRREIKYKFEEIVDFSGIERYIDTPVKRYSSGMYVRLAFAVAAHLESEILIVDEVLAVGDSEFQKKCLGKMGDISKGEGRTVLFVSHNMAAIKQLCHTGILLKDGTIHDMGVINNIIDDYIELNSTTTSEFKFIDDPNKKVQIIEAKLLNSISKSTNRFIHGEDLIVEIIIEVKHYLNARLNVSVMDRYDSIIFINRKTLNHGINIFSAKLNGNTLVPNTYKLSIALDSPGVEIFDIIENAIKFEIVDNGNDLGINGDTDNGIIISPLIWK